MKEFISKLGNLSPSSLRDLIKVFGLDDSDNLSQKGTKEHKLQLVNILSNYIISISKKSFANKAMIPFIVGLTFFIATNILQYVQRARLTDLNTEITDLNSELTKNNKLLNDRLFIIDQEGKISMSKIDSILIVIRTGYPDLPIDSAYILLSNKMDFNDFKSEVGDYVGRAMDLKWGGIIQLNKLISNTSDSIKKEYAESELIKVCSKLESLQNSTYWDTVQTTSLTVNGIRLDTIKNFQMIDALKIFLDERAWVFHIDGPITLVKKFNILNKTNYKLYELEKLVDSLENEEFNNNN